MKGEAYNLHTSVPQSDLVTEELLRGTENSLGLYSRFNSISSAFPLNPKPLFLAISFLAFSPFAVFVIPQSAVLENGLSFQGLKQHISSQVQSGIKAHTCSLTFALTLQPTTEAVGVWCAHVYSAFESSGTPPPPPAFEGSHLKPIGCLCRPLN